jgi:nitroreductase
MTMESLIESLVLPPPNLRGGRPLMEVLKDRKSDRSFSDKPVEPQHIADLLWAACGVNRPDVSHLTAPSAMNWQEIHVYVVVPQGLFRYEKGDGTLSFISGIDLRELAGTQDFVADAPLNLIYAADVTKIEGTDKDRTFFAGTDTAFMAQNVYLYCASVGLNCVVRALIDRKKLAAAMQLPPSYRITLGQTVGWPV